MCEKLKRDVNDLRDTVRRLERALLLERETKREALVKADAGYPWNAVHVIRGHMKSIDRTGE